MNPLNRKARTIKIPRGLLSPTEENHLLDVLLACAYQSANRIGDSERQLFEHYIANSPDTEISQRIKEVLAGLDREEKNLLFL